MMSCGIELAPLCARENTEAMATRDDGGIAEHAVLARRVAAILVVFIAALWSAASATPATAQGRATADHGGRPDWDYDGNRILGHIGNDVCLWDAKTGLLLKGFYGHRERIFSVRFSPDDKQALTSSYATGGDLPYQSKDTSVRLWDLASGQQRLRLDGEIAPQFSPDGRRILTFRENGPNTDINMWDTASGRKLFTVGGAGFVHVFPVGLYFFIEVRFSPDGSEFMYFNFGKAIVWNSDDGHEVGRVSAATAITTTAHFGGTHGIATFGRGDAGTRYPLVPPASVIETWDLDTKQRTRDVPLGSTAVFGDGDWTSDGKQVVGVGRDAEVRGKDPGPCRVQIWNVTSGAATRADDCSPRPSPVQSRPLVSPDDKHFLVHWTGDDGSAALDLYDLNTGRQIAQISVGSENLDRSLVGFSPDSKTFLYKTGEIAFTVYSSETGNALGNFELHGG